MKPRPLTNRARSLRNSANTPEQVAWEALREFRKHGYPVRRQHAIRRFVVDFAIVKAKLVIEIDGSIHNLPEVAEADALREKEISEAGWRVLRVPATAAMSKDHLCALVQKELGL
ncbi:MAG: endonuclease domain-containing protein [Parvularculaceae bacterium]